jgi:uncharacterized protein
MAKKASQKEYTFTARGHPNIRATHTSTFMFTKDKECTTRGDCIVGVAADFDLPALEKFLSGTHAITIAISVSGEKNRSLKIKAMANQEFSDREEIVIRTSGYRDWRTLAMGASDSANMLEKEIVWLLRRPDTKMTITLLA